MKRDEALKILAEHRDKLRQQFGVTSLAIFGSAQWRDRVESYNPFLDPDTATVGVGISYTF